MKKRLMICLLALWVLSGIFPFSLIAGAEPDTTQSPTALSETTSASEVTTPVEIPEEAVLSVGGTLTESDLTFSYGKKKTLTMDVINSGGSAAHDVSLTPIISNDASVFPFKITRADWMQMVTNASSEALLPEGISLSDLSSAPDGHNTGYASFVFDVRSDAPGGYYPLHFTLQYTQNGETITREVVLQVLVSSSAMARHKGLIEGTEVKNELHPEISCSTLPQEVMAGEPFTLSLTVTNPFADIELSDLRLVVASAQEGVFLPVSGAAAQFVAALAPGASESFSLEMNTPADLAPQRYELSFKLEYSDENAALHTLEAKTAIPVHQPAELTLSDVNLVPGTGIVNQSVNLMVNLYNTGNTQLSNVLVRLESEGAVRSEDYFAGNMAAGATSMMDVLIVPLQSGALPCTLLVSYEDEMGRSCQVEKEFILQAELPTVTVGSVVMTPPPPEDTPAEAVKAYPPWFIPVILSAVTLALILLVILIIVIRRRNRKHIRRNMDHYLDKE